MSEELSEFYRSLAHLSVEETHFQIIAKACEGTAVKPEAFIAKIAPLPATFDPQEAAAWSDGVLEMAKNGDIEYEEGVVMMRYHRMFMDFMWQLIKTKLPDLPEFQE